MQRNQFFGDIVRHALRNNFDLEGAFRDTLARTQEYQINPAHPNYAADHAQFGARMSSIFTGFDFQNSEDVIRLADALRIYVGGGDRTIVNLDADEEETVVQIDATYGIARIPLLRAMIHRFRGSTGGGATATQILNAAGDLLRFFITAALDPTDLGYPAAEAAFEEEAGQIIGTYQPNEEAENLESVAEESQDEAEDLVSSPPLTQTG